MIGSERFAVALTCIDGRIHDPLRAWALRTLSVDVLDLVTVQGPDGVMSSTDDEWIDRLADRVKVSRHAHNSIHLVVASHTDCAGHPVDEGQHHHDVGLAASRMRSLLPQMTVVAVHVAQVEHGWVVIPVDCGALEVVRA